MAINAGNFVVVGKEVEVVQKEEVASTSIASNIQVGNMVMINKPTYNRPVIEDKDDDMLDRFHRNSSYIKDMINK